MPRVAPPRALSLYPPAEFPHGHPGDTVATRGWEPSCWRVPTVPTVPVAAAQGSAEPKLKGWAPLAVSGCRPGVVCSVTPKSCETHRGVRSIQRAQSPSAAGR